MRTEAEWADPDPDEDDAPDITSQAWVDEMHEAFWDRWNAKALENAYMPNPADDRCEASS